MYLWLHPARKVYYPRKNIPPNLGGQNPGSQNPGSQNPGCQNLGCQNPVGQILRSSSSSDIEKWQESGTRTQISFHRSLILGTLQTRPFRCHVLYRLVGLNSRIEKTRSFPPFKDWWNASSVLECESIFLNYPSCPSSFMPEFTNKVVSYFHLSKNKSLGSIQIWCMYQWGEVVCPRHLMRASELGYIGGCPPIAHWARSFHP